MTSSELRIARGKQNFLARPLTHGDDVAAPVADVRWAMLGPLWAAGEGWWGFFLFAAIVELIGLVLVGYGLSSLGSGWLVPTLLLVGGALLLAGLRLALRAMASSPGIDRSQPVAHDTRLARAGFGLAVLAFTYTLTLLRFNGDGVAQVLSVFPAPEHIAPSVARAIDFAVKWSIVAFGAFFEAIRIAIFWILNGVEAAFVLTPWPVTALFILLIAWRTGGMGALVFSAGAVAYLGLFGFWEKSMSTLALVAASVIVCVAMGTPLGVLSAKSRRFQKLLEPVLDVMQTLPTFVYLIPAVAFFSIGKPPGVVATVIFAMPPMIRLTALGIRQVPEQVREAALAFGATSFQLLVKVELPLAVPSVLAGINQVIMMSLSMVVIAGLIGAGGLGVDVIRALNFLQIGQGFLAGIAIVLMAMTLDRIVRGRGDGLRKRQE
ncbi:MAG: ABC transporter permease subunit [Pseudomonadota bacterium]|nr:ABC transporter permease subunit [Pseudomonadota bacterium]